MTMNLTDEPLHDFVLMHTEHTQARGLVDIVLRRTNDLLLGVVTPQRVRIVFDTLVTHFGWSTSEQHKQFKAPLALGFGQPTCVALFVEFKEFEV